MREGVLLARRCRCTSKRHHPSVTSGNSMPHLQIDRSRAAAGQPKGFLGCISLLGAGERHVLLCLGWHQLICTRMPRMKA